MNKTQQPKFDLSSYRQISPAFHVDIPTLEDFVSDCIEKVLSFNDQHNKEQGFYPPVILFYREIFIANRKNPFAFTFKLENGCIHPDSIIVLREMARYFLKRTRSIYN